MEVIKQNIMLAALYALFGRLALLLALPPGYASPIWPAAGIALAFMIRYGYKVAPGVLIGSILVNIWTALEAPGSSGIFHSGFITVGISCGALFQAIFGKYLTERLVEAPIVLVSQKTVLRFFIYAGLLGSIVSPSFGVCTLASQGIIPWQNAWLNWSTWWIGDVIGVFLFVPITLIWIGGVRETWASRMHSLLIPLLVMFVLIGVLFGLTNNLERKDINYGFQRDIETVADNLEDNFSEIAKSLRAIRNFFRSSTFVDRQEFTVFTKEMIEALPHVDHLGWAPEVSHEELAQFLVATREDSELSTYELQEDERDTQNEAVENRVNHYPILYLESSDEEKDYFGFDLGSNVKVLQAIEQVKSSHSAAVITGLGAAQEDIVGLRNLVVLPVLAAPNSSEVTNNEVRREQVGILMAEFDLPALFSRSIEETESLSQSLKKLSGSFYRQTPERTLIHHVGSTLKDGHAVFTSSFSFESMDEQWMVEFRATQEYLENSRSWAMWFVMVGGFAFIALLAAFLLIMSGHSTEELLSARNELEAEVLLKERVATDLADQAKKMRQQQDAMMNILEDAEEAKRNAEKAERAIRESELKFKNAFQYSAIGFALVSPEGRWLQVNPALCDITGYNKDELLQTDFQSITHSEDLQRDLDQVNELLEGNINTYTMEKRYIHKQGHLVWASLTVSLVRDENDMPAYFISQIQDISSRKRAEKLLVDSEQLQRFWLNQTTDGIWDWNLETNDYYMSPKMKSQFGYEDSEIPNTYEGWKGIVHPEDIEKVEEAFNRHIQGDEDYHVTIRFKHKDGSTIWSLSRGISLENESGKKDRMLGTSTNISELKQTEQRLSEMAEELQRSNSELEQFAYVASHDLQEPLRKVVGFTQLVEQEMKDVLTEKSKTYMEFVIDGAKRMQTLIQDLLQYSRVGSADIKSEPVDFNAVVKEAISNLALVIEESKAEVSVGDLPTLNAHRSFMVRLLQNLIGNALKYRGERPPRIEVKAETKGEMCEFTISDNGIGIDPKYADRIFVIFQRLHAKGEYEGTGIGLAICRRMVERHGGRLWLAESIEGEGSTFKFTIPLNMT